MYLYLISVLLAHWAESINLPIWKWVLPLKVKESPSRTWIWLHCDVQTFAPFCFGCSVSFALLAH